ncbi:MAG TPA: DNA-directed RNA polymerase subunit omega [Saprospiraceae bacterium]|nr:DNA-directed RNA polymerase subunit omega [Saprospiraceae bacterium]
MTDIKTKAQGIDPNVSARDIEALAGKTGNAYKSLNVIASRARQLSQELKNELHKKLEEFATVTDTIEEVHENKEQIEISKFYERLPNPTIIAYHEFMDNELEYRQLGPIDESDEESEDEA